MDPLGLYPGQHIVSAVSNAIGSKAEGLARSVNGALPKIHEVMTYVAAGSSLCAAALSETVVIGGACGLVALGSASISAGTGLVLYAEGKQSGLTTAEDVAGLGLAGTGVLAKAGAASAGRLARLAEAISSARSGQASAAASSWNLPAAFWLALSADRWEMLGQYWRQVQESLVTLESRADRAGAALGAWQSLEAYEEKCEV